ncbi:hypothetical protein [Flavobacterium nitrogenifigens]|uniref:Uncharacterized protein n=1 Tax=Flavobacterium nitrogenifigens TaxID=1617283 RepID=A0A521EG82_9FLAO|nr:hypothetical protein [Flavobacterium nitrogenifigens]KAF2326043.1 hypothetical protein DM397_22580 [Flavobacterium nitrogenifigens]SMO82898.1 hypothetical protein SAMN06265220_104253 [Flavobacterium nitrogenifigens]
MAEIFRKNKILLFLGLFLSISASAQVVSIEGEWSTKDIIGYSNVFEYSLIKEKQLSEGRSVIFNLNGTFSCGEPMICPNGCSVYTSGSYTMVDNDHIRIAVENVRFVGFYCGNLRTKQENKSKDLGLFYIYKEGDAVRLIPSNGVLQEDKDKMLYAQMLDSFKKEWRSYVFVWNDTDGNLPDEILKDCKDKRKQIDLSNYKIVSSKNENYGNVFLLRENENFYYVVYNAVDKKVSLAYPK